MASFTTKYPIIVNKLINQVKVINNDKIFKCNALWDTGASGTCISSRLAKGLNLMPTGFTIMKTPSGSSYVKKYLVDIALPNNVTIKGIAVCDSAISNQGFDVLIGMDIITRGDFSVSNFNKTAFSFRMPSQEAVDFVHQDRLKQIIGPKHDKAKK